MGRKEVNIPVVTTLALTDRIRVVTDPGSEPKSRSITFADFLTAAGLMDILQFIASASGSSNPTVSTTIVNDLGTTISFARTATGNYELQILDADDAALSCFTANETVLPNEILHTFTEGDGTESNRRLTFTRTSASKITIENAYLAGEKVDGFEAVTFSISVKK